ncbi:hypothetical protein EF847_12105 [Actinobacteria bacterium YIM 96077]|uniref:NUDIX hydrolase n=1 Tax=Phytoactinopolyspora halophila TaxID=1981511 RepID=A0A329QZ22_9ACTN|nr:hypothetical protein EF847_12105 [Actinobacteria bacterium YIM 96077]RAW17664.1 hypothetical protein DPM12_05325 [Phytoactinopolyspora halophila]
MIAFVLLLLGVYLSWTAGRLDRLHARVDASQAVLEAELLRRSASALELATAGLLDPATSVVMADAASRARVVGAEHRYQAESDLTAVLCAGLDAPEDLAALRDEVQDLDAALDELGMACRRVAHARRFHNEMVRGVQRLRRKALVRWLRLAGHAPLPETVEFDDTVPRGLSG